MAIPPLNSNPAVAGAPVPATTVPPLAGAADASRIAPVGDAQSGQLTPDDETLSQALRELNQRLHAWSTNLRFQLDDETSRVVVQVVDAETGDVVRQIPSEEVVQMSKMLGKLQDLAFRASA